MSDVRYAFLDPCGMEMIIMVIIQHLNNPFFLSRTLGSTSAQGPDVGVSPHKHACVSRRYRMRQGGETGRSDGESATSAFKPHSGGGERVAVPRA